MMTRLVRVLLIVFLLVPSASACASEGGGAEVNPLWVIPFVTLLLAIAVAPFINKHWWEHNYPYVATGLGSITLAYYLFGLGNTERVVHTGYEYISFICLIGSLFVVAGGIVIRLRGRSRPIENLTLLAIGAVLSNVVGTTGASMILIRPYLRINRYRIKPFHVVFFIFVVSNMGGALTPIGDPPLFLGYLKGIPFFWVAEHLWGIWLVGMGGILGVFYVLDSLLFHRLSRRVQEAVEHEEEVGEVAGLHNIVFLVMILIAVFITSPIFLREALMVIAAAASYLTTHRDLHRKNEFNFLPIKEVAVLFVGIFATMMPALDWLEHNSARIGIQSAADFYWATGVLSAFLDNAPTYLNFLSAQIGLFVDGEIVQQVQHLVATHGADIALLGGPHAEEVQNTFAALLRYHFDHVEAGSVSVAEISTAYLIGNHAIHVMAISIAAVFFGACTYIGNGPNFMVKSIAEQAGVRCPSFFGYLFRYSIPVLLPLFTLVWFLFFRL